MNEKPNVKKSKILSLTPTGEYKSNYKFGVTFENKDQVTFFEPKENGTEFPYNEGDVIEYYISNPQYKSARLVKKKEDNEKQDEIRKSVALNNAVNAISNQLLNDEDIVKKVKYLSKEFYQILKTM